MRCKLLIAALALCPIVQATDLVSIGQTGIVRVTNDVTGATSIVSLYNFFDIQGLAHHSGNGLFYFVDSNKLYSFNLGDAAPVFRRNLSFVTGFMNDIAIDRAGIAWGVETDGDTFRLWRFGIGSGETLIGNMDFDPELDFGRDGSLYGWKNHANVARDGLFIVNRQTAAVTRLSPNASQPEITGFAVHPQFPALARGFEFNQPRLFTANLISGTLTDTVYPGFGARGADYALNMPFGVAGTLGAVNFGRVDSNNANCLADRDGDVLRVCKFIVPNQTVPPIQFEVNINGPSGQSIFDMLVHSRMNTSGSFRAHVDAKRISDSQFVQLFTYNPTTSYTNHSLQNLQVSTYLNANGDGTFRVRVFQTGPSSSPSYCFELDQFVVEME